MARRYTRQAREELEEDYTDDDSDSDGEDDDDDLGFFQTIKQVLTNIHFVCICLALTFLYYIITGI